MMKWTQWHVYGTRWEKHKQLRTIPMRTKGTTEGKPDNAIMKVTFDFILFHMKIS